MKNIIPAFIFFSIAFMSKAQSTYTMDKNHTKVEFVATHFGISHVEGRFKNVAVTLVASKDDFSDALIEMIAEVKSIDTDIEMRDNDLRSANWFEADKFSTIVFKNREFKKAGGNKYKLNGNITIHGVTKPISFDVIYNGKGINPMTKRTSVGFTITGKLHRDDFMVGTGAGNGVVSNEIELISNAEFIVN